MDKRQQIISVVEDYLYTRDDVIDGNEVSMIAMDIAIKLVPIV